MTRTLDVFVRCHGKIIEGENLQIDASNIKLHFYCEEGYSLSGFAADEVIKRALSGNPYSPTTLNIVQSRKQEDVKRRDYKNNKPIEIYSSNSLQNKRVKNCTIHPADRIICPGIVFIVNNGEKQFSIVNNLDIDNLDFKKRLKDESLQDLKEAQKKQYFRAIQSLQSLLNILSNNEINNNFDLINIHWTACRASTKPNLLINDLVMETKGKSQFLSIIATQNGGGPVDWVNQQIISLCRNDGLNRLQESGFIGQVLESHLVL
jgi:hypothetical protein